MRKCPLQPPALEHSWWHYLGGLLEEVQHWAQVLKVSSLAPLSTISQIAAPAAPPCLPHQDCLISLESQAKTNLFYLQLLWLWHLIAPTGK